MESETEEIWKDVVGAVGFEGRYEVSNLGFVRSLYYGGHKRKVPKIKKTQIGENGYVSVLLQNGSLMKRWKLSRLILTVFDKPMPSHIDTCHINNVKTDNRLENLIWGSKKENASHRIIHGTDCRGEKHWKSKLTEEQVSHIRLLHKQGIRVTNIAKQLGITQSNVWAICNNKLWRHIK